MGPKLRLGSDRFAVATPPRGTKHSDLLDSLSQMMPVPDISDFVLAARVPGRAASRLRSGSLVSAVWSVALFDRTRSILIAWLSRYADTL